MKAFLFDLVGKAQRTSQSLDIKAIICNKTWRVFSDTNEKEVHIFMEDGSLVISVDGKVEMGKWMYVPANQSLVISGNKQNFLVHPVVCNNMLALIQDGTNMCSFLLDDTKAELEQIRTLQNVEKYIGSNINRIPQAIGTSDKTNVVLSTSTNGSDYVEPNNNKTKIKSKQQLEQEITYPPIHDKSYTIPGNYLWDDYCQNQIKYDDKELKVAFGTTVFDSIYYYKGFKLTGEIQDREIKYFQIKVRYGKIEGILTMWDDERHTTAVTYNIENGKPRQWHKWDPQDTYWESIKFVLTKARLSYRDFPISLVEYYLKKIQPISESEKKN